MSIQQIKINHVCKTTPPTATIGGNTGFDQVQWCASNPHDTFTLHLPGGYFVGYLNDFQLPIAGKSWQPVPALQLVPNLIAPPITKYVFDTNGVGCLLAADSPPEIVIEADLTGKHTTHDKKK
jgi:hypothetical protein